MSAASQPQPLSTAAFGPSAPELPNVAVPRYDRSALRRSIVHIGVGGFHRSHLAAYVDELCRAGNTDWAIVGTGTLAGDGAMATALESQDHLYTLITRGAGETSVRIIGSIVDYLHAHPDPRNLIEQVAHPDTQVISLTVTEGGYPINDQTGVFDPLSNTAGPGSAFAILAEGLELRRISSGAPVTILSCDNILANGTAAKRSTLGEAGRFGDALVQWIGESVSFPDSMVDRITPATTDNDRKWLRQTHGIDDLWPVVTEPFRQWVVEDDFAGDRLPLEAIDVIVTDDVGPYELMKLRLLNASHSCLAYPAALLGIEHVHEAMADPDIVDYVRRLLELEAAPPLPEIKGIDIDAYVASLIERFSNPAIGDQISRLCQDGSAKFPKFLIPTIEAQLESGGPIECATFALAAWCDYLARSVGSTATIDAAPDSGLDKAQTWATASLADSRAFLAFDAVFPPSLVANERFTQSFADSLESIRGDGLRSTLTDVARGHQEHRGGPTS